MFTGLIEEVGAVRAIDTTAEGSRIVISAETVLQNVQLGDSIAIDGACTTVVAFDAESFTIEASPETLSKTTFGAYKPGRRVNLERPLTPQARIGGHYVTGHVDGLARVVARYPEGNSVIYEFEMQNDELAALLVPKGSVAVLGISLTVNRVEGRRFSVAIIPHTLTHTNLDIYGEGDLVNIETDLLGKYVQKMLAAQLPALQAASGQSLTQAADEPMLQAESTPLNLHTGNWFNHDYTDTVAIDEEITPLKMIPAEQPYINFKPAETPNPR